MKGKISIHESEITQQDYPDRWSKDLIGSSSGVETTSGFSIGVAEYHTAEFGELQVHDDQEALYVISDVGQVRVGEHSAVVCILL